MIRKIKTISHRGHRERHMGFSSVISVSSVAKKVLAV
jgi:hypothetical protein